MPLILGIDPGSRQTGYGLLNSERRAQPVYVHSGVIRTRANNLPGRLAEIFKALNQLVQQYQPDEVAIEQVFLAQNAGAALKLGQARGAAIVAAVQYDLPLFEYSAKQIKQAVVGYGAAEKQQMQLMVRHLLHLTHMPQSDEADALGVAWCHSQARASPLMADPARQAADESGRPTGLGAAWQSRGRRGAALRKWAKTRATTNGQASRSVKKPAEQRATGLSDNNHCNNQSNKSSEECDP